MRLILTLFLVLGLFACDSSAQPAARSAPASAPTPVAPSPAPAPAASVSSFAQRPVLMDFGIPMAPWRHADLDFRMFKDRWALLYFFAPGCGHCQISWPKVRQFGQRWSARGLALTALATGMTTPEDLAMFDAELRLDVPVFRDTTRLFSRTYGTGSVPLMLLVRPDGSFTMFPGADPAHLVRIDSILTVGLPSR